MSAQEGANGQVTRDTGGSGQGLARVDHEAGPGDLEAGETWGERSRGGEQG